MTVSARLRVLLVTRNLPPLVGGMERLNWHMAAELAKTADVRIVGPVGSAALAPAGVPTREAVLKPLWKFLLQARSLARREAQIWKPDVVLAGSGLMAPLARTAARTCDAKTAVYVHGLDVAVRHPVYRAIWLPAIRRADRVIANSHATAALCRDVGVGSARIGIVSPGVDLPGESLARKESNPDEANGVEPFSRLESGRGEGTGSHGAAGSSFRARHGLADRPLLLSVGRLSARKGLREFVAQALPRMVASHPDVMLLVVGDAPKDALHAESQTVSSIQAAADAAGVGGHIRFLGVITDYAVLGAIYRAADVHVFPVRSISGDPEGFGMVAVEAAAHGLPTVAFATGGVVDAVAEGRSGHLVTPGDYAAFAAAASRVLAAGGALGPDCRKFAAQFAWPLFGARVAEQLGAIVLADSKGMTA